MSTKKEQSGKKLSVFYLPLLPIVVTSYGDTSILPPK